MNGAEQPAPPDTRLAFHVTGTGPYVITHHGGAPTKVATPDDVLFVLYRECHRQLIERMAGDGWHGVHAALVRVEGRRVMVMGHKGTGKTTLALRLLYDGHSVEGDEMVLTRHGVAVAQPRRFHLKPGTAALVPDVADIIDSLPCTWADGARISGFDPAAAGFAWRLVEGSVDGLVVLRQNHGGTSVLTPMSSAEAALHVVDHALLSGLGDDDHRALVTACADLVRAAHCAVLTVGDLPSTVTALVDFATLLPA